MSYHKFTNPDGTLDCFVNLDAIIAARAGEDGKIILQSSTLSVVVDASQFEKAVVGNDGKWNRLCQVVEKLIRALDRLGVRIPTSVRLRM